MRLARAFDEAAGDRAAASFARRATAVTKFWICRRTPATVAEALECLGGNRYIEESILPRLYRAAPVNSIWEGSGNVLCLDVQRTLVREPTALEVMLAELDQARGADLRLDAWLVRLKNCLREQSDPQLARRLVESLALALQAAMLVQHAPPAVAEAFCASRLTDGNGRQFGILPRGLDLALICERARPHVA
jgi:putative acyl-CoA dehydrogenase